MFLRQSFCDVWTVSMSFFEEQGFEVVFRKEAMDIIKISNDKYEITQKFNFLK